MAKLLDHLPRRFGATGVRIFRSDDVAPFARYRADAGLARYQGWSPIDDAAARAFVDEMAAVTGLVPDGWIQLAIADAASDTLVGDLGVYVDAEGSEAEVGFTVAREFHGRGHAANALRLLADLLSVATGIGSLLAVTDTRNLASIRVLERCGYAAVGEHAAVFKGESCVERVYRLPLSRTSNFVKAAPPSGGL